MKTLKQLPQFETEAEERKFWETHDSTEYVDWSKAQHISPITRPITDKNDSNSDPRLRSR
jgi:hypothetical protein